MKRAGAEVRALMHIGHETAQELEVIQVGNSTSLYEFQFEYDELGVAILEFYIDGEQIPQSPIRVQGMCLSGLFVCFYSVGFFLFSFSLE
jgi:hypothetical protein